MPGGMFAITISSLGLLQPIGIRSDNTLVCGGRRLLAVKNLGWTHIPAHVCRDLKDELAYLEAERDENTCREPMTPPGALALSKKLEPKYRKLGKEAKQEGQKKGGGDRKSKAAKDRSGGKFPQNETRLNQTNP